MSASAARRRVTDLSSQISKSPDDIKAYKADIKSCRRELRKLIDTVNCHPILVRLSWHDAGTYDNSVTQWPTCGGANGSIRFDIEQNHGANAGLRKALTYLSPLKQKFTRLSWADIIQLGGATAPSYPCGTGALTFQVQNSVQKKAIYPTRNRRLVTARRTLQNTFETFSTAWASGTKRSSR